MLRSAPKVPMFGLVHQVFGKTRPVVPGSEVANVHVDERDIWFIDVRASLPSSTLGPRVEIVRFSPPGTDKNITVPTGSRNCPFRCSGAEGDGGWE